DVPTLPANMRVGELAERIAKHDPQVSRHQGMVIVDAETTCRNNYARGCTAGTGPRSPRGNDCTRGRQPKAGRNLSRACTKLRPRCCVTTSAACRSWSEAIHEKLSVT